MFKKINYFFFFLLITTLSMSCSSEGEGPAESNNITIKSEGLDNKQEPYYAGQNITFDIKVTTTGEDLEKLTISGPGKNSRLIYSDLPNLSDTGGLTVVGGKEVWQHIDYTLEAGDFTEDNKTVTVEIRAEDKSGEYKNEVITINTETGEPPILKSNIEVIKIGDAAATGLRDYGMYWSENYSGQASLRSESTDGRLVLLENSEWEQITASEEIEDVIMNADEYIHISTINIEASDEIDVWCGHKHHDKYYIFHFTNVDVKEEAGEAKITITGEVWQ